MVGKRSRRPVVLLRPLPRRTLVHDLWAGTKLIVLTGVAALLAIYPGWISVATVTALVMVTALLARVPRGAVPSPPTWLWIVFLLGAAAALVAGGTPFIDVGATRVGIGGLLGYLQLTLISATLLGLGALVSWTTNVAEIAPAVATLGWPLRVLRVPVEDWAVSLALALRAFPMLLVEFRTLFAARRLRPRPIRLPWRRRHRQWTADLMDQLTAAMTVSLRRADEMGDAITARGGSGQIVASPARPGFADAVALTVVFAVMSLAGYLEHTRILFG